MQALYVSRHALAPHPVASTDLRKAGIKSPRGKQPHSFATDP
jgi:hypothetical protein